MRYASLFITFIYWDFINCYSNVGRISALMLGRQAVRSFSVGSADHAYSKENSLVFFNLFCTHKYKHFCSSAYVTKEAHETPMDMKSSTDRNATTLFFSEMLRGKLKYHYLCWGHIIIITT